MRTPRTLRTTAIAAIATAGISLGAASGAMAATAPDTAAPSSVSVEAAAHSKAKVKAKTVKLRDGSTAKVYKLGKHKAKAVISGPKGGKLIANGKNAYANHNGLHIKLTPGGALTSWMDKAKPKPKPKPEKRQHVRNDTLADGSMARVYKLSPTHWQAVTSAGSLDANGRTALGNHNGMHIKLTASGGLTSWMDKAGDQAPQPAPDDDVQPDPQPTPDDEVQPDPQPNPDEHVTPDEHKPAPDEHKPAPDTDQTAPDSTVTPVPAPVPAA
ncbi:hypothetical protein [Streptomyces sp. NPDC046925]|uniref:hypothetical protein n=1 Tax=Streptomyces sp. NPDC046925 TaxID=3155375 RepID=UPI0033F61BFA